MDAVDSKQQQEIDDLKKRAEENRQVDHNQYEKINDLNAKDARHDALFTMMQAIMIFLVLSTFLNWFMMFYVVTKK